MSKYEISKTGYYSQSQLFKWIWSDYLKDYKVMIIIAIILMIIEGSTFGLLSYFIEPMFDQVFAKGDHTAIKWVSLSVAGIFILRAFLFSVALRLVLSFSVKYTMCVFHF